MDPGLIQFAGIIMVALIAGFFALRGTRSQVSQSGADSFRADLLTRVGQQDARLATQDARLTAYAAEVEQLRDQVDALERSDGDKAARIRVLTSWGTHSTAAVPRTPPAWLDQ